MLIAKGIKTGYTGVSLIDLGFSGRIRNKYGLFSENFFHGISMILRKDPSKGKQGNRIYRNIYNHSLIFNLYHSFSGDSYYPESFSLARQNEESRSIGRDLSGPGLEYINRWYLSLQRYIRPATISGWGGYQAPPMISGDRSWSAQSIGGETLFGAEARPAMEPWSAYGPAETRVGSPAGRKLRQALSLTQDETNRRFSRDLRRVSMGRLNYEQQTTSAILNIMRNLHNQFMNYQTGKRFTDYDITSAEHAGRMAENRDHRQPGYLKEDSSGEQLMGYNSWLDWYQGHHLHRIKRLEEEMTFERQVLENHRLRLTTRLRHLNREIKEAIENKLEQGEGLTEQIGTQPRRFSYRQDWLREKRWLKLELERISALQESQIKPAEGDTQSAGEGLPARLTIKESEPDRQQEQDAVIETRPTLDWAELGNTNRAGDSPDQPKAGPVDIMPETARELIARRAYELLVQGTGTDLVYNKKLNYNGLLDEKSVQETAIWRKQQQLLRVIELMEQMNMPSMRSVSKADIPTDINRFTLTTGPADGLSEAKDQYFESAALMVQRIDRYQQNLVMAESLNRLQDLIRYPLEYLIRIRRRELYKSAAQTVEDKEMVTQTQLYDYQKPTAGDLAVSGATSNNAPELLIRRHRKTIMPGWYIAEVAERLRVIQNFQASHDFRQHELRKQIEIWNLLKAGRGRAAGRGPEYSEFIEGPPSFYYYTRPGGAKEEKQRREPRYPKQDQTLDYIYNLKRWMQKSTDIFAETWNRVWYNTALTELLNDSGLNNGDRTASASREGPTFLIQKMRQLNQDTSSTRNIAVYKEEAATLPGMITKNQMFFINTQGRWETGPGLTELSILHRNVPGIVTMASGPEDFSKYSQIEYHRQGKEPEVEPKTVPTRNEEVFNSQVFSDAGEIKIDQANMERIVNNVYNEIERRLEFERERRGL